MYKIDSFNRGTRFNIKGDASEYETEFTTEDGRIKAINLTSGTSGFIPVQNVIKIINVASVQIESEDIQILGNVKPSVIEEEEPPVKTRRRKRQKKEQ